MKTAEEYIVIGGDKIPSTEMIYASHKTVCKMFEQAQKDAYNQALEDVDKIIQDSDYYVTLSIIEEISKLKKQ